MKKRNHLYFFFLLALLALQPSCTSFNRGTPTAATDKNSKGASASLQDTNDPMIAELANKEAVEEEDDEEETIPDELPLDPEAGVDNGEEYVGEGFCRDDIYSSYLIDQYMKTAPVKKAPTAKVKGKKRRRGESVSSRETEALHFANMRINGPTPPYFGGLPVVTNPVVEQWIHYFKTRGRKHFIKWLVRSQSTQNLVLPILQKEGMPQELYFLAMIESGFSNSAYSSAKATGTWQFMSGTAKLYGLKINHWVDERRDPVKSTVAAGRYLRDLYGLFGDWYLAIASYNAGPGKIKSAIRKSGSNDFWKIAQTSYIRSETKHYVPKMLAAMIIATNPSGHGFNVIANPQDITPTTTVAVKRPLELDDIAHNLGLNGEDLRRWNPELIKNVTPPPTSLKNVKDGYQLRLPETYAEKFASVEAALPDLEIQDVMIHKVKRGETLQVIARRYKVAVKQIISLNPELAAKRLKIGREIAIPVPAVVKRVQRQMNPVDPVAASVNVMSH